MAKRATFDREELTQLLGKAAGRKLNLAVGEYEPQVQVAMRGGEVLGATVDMIPIRHLMTLDLQTADRGTYIQRGASVWDQLQPRWPPQPLGVARHDAKPGAFVDVLVEPAAKIVPRVGVDIPAPVVGPAAEAQRGQAATDDARAKAAAILREKHTFIAGVADYKKCKGCLRRDARRFCMWKRVYRQDSHPACDALVLLPTDNSALELAAAEDGEDGE